MVSLAKDAHMNQIAMGDFAKYLANRNLLPTVFESASSHHASAERSLRKLWEATELTANGFADEVATFYGLKRLTLPQLVTAPSLAGRFSPRFLRDTAVFPFEFPQGHYRLAVADPSDTAEP
jgi:general secretion pathway protein E